MLLGCKHEDDEDKFGREEHLDEAALRDGGLAREGGVHVEGAREEGGDYAGGAHACEELGEEDVDGADGADCSDEVEAECDLIL